MPRPWENFEESYPGQIDEIYGPKVAENGTTREEFYDKMVANGWNQPGDDDLIMAMYLKTALHFKRHDTTKQIDVGVFGEILKSNGNDTASRKNVIDRCKSLFTDSKNPNLAKGEERLELESNKLDPRHLEFVAQMRAKGWTHEGDDKIIEMLYGLPDHVLSDGSADTFRGKMCMDANGNEVESRRNLIQNVIGYINNALSNDEKNEHAETLTSLGEELEKHEKLSQLKENDYGKAEIALEESEIRQKLDAFMRNKDIVGAADYTVETIMRFNNNKWQKINDPKTNQEADVIGDWLDEIMGERPLKEDEQLFLFDLCLELQKRIDESYIKMGLLIEEQEEEIRKNPPKGSELIIDNPKIVTAMAKDYLFNHSGHEHVNELNSLREINGTLYRAILGRFNFDLNKRPVNIKGIDYEPDIGLEDSEIGRLIDKHNARLKRNVADKYTELSEEKKKKYLTDDLNPKQFAKEKYKVSLRKGGNGKLEIESLPDDIKKIKTMNVQGLYDYREKQQKLIAINKKIQVLAIEIGTEFGSLLNEFKSFMYSGHPAWKKCQPVYDVIDSLEASDAQSTANSIDEKLELLINEVKAYKKNYGGDILNDGGRRNDFITKVGNIAERYRAGFRGLAMQAEPKDSLERDISNYTDTIRRIDKQLELKGAPPAPEKKMGFVPDPSTQVADILEVVNKAEEAVWKSSNQYKRANRSLIELNRAFNDYNNTSEENKGLRREKLEAIRTIIGGARTNVNSYFKRKTDQGLMDGSANLKTQRRIDIMKEADRLLNACDEFVNDRIGEINEENEFKKIKLGKERRYSVAKKPSANIDDFVKKQEDARKAEQEKLNKENAQKQADEKRAKEPVDIEAKRKNAQEEIIKIKNEGKDLNSPEVDKHLATIVTCIKLNSKKNGDAIGPITEEKFDSINYRSTQSSPVFDKMLEQSNRNFLIEEATYDKGQNLFATYSRISKQVKEENKKMNKKAEDLRTKYTNSTFSRPKKNLQNNL